MRAILPTHTCFDDALDVLADMVKASPSQTADLFLVHGLCRAPDGHLYAHAWVEWERTPADVQCVFAGILEGECGHFMGDRAAYYAEIHVEETTRYPVEAAIAENVRHNHYGPWVARYREHCRTQEATP